MGVFFRFLDPLTSDINILKLLMQKDPSQLNYQDLFHVAFMRQYDDVYKSLKKYAEESTDLSGRKSSDQVTLSRDQKKELADIILDLPRFKNPVKNKRHWFF